jgi:hypothetical protein
MSDYDCASGGSPHQTGRVEPIAGRRNVGIREGCGGGISEAHVRFTPAQWLRLARER